MRARTVVLAALLAAALVLSGCRPAAGGPDNQPPVARIELSHEGSGGALDFRVGVRTILDGTGSSDPEQQSLSFAWEMSAVPVTSACVLEDCGTPLASVVPDCAGSYQARLVVSDGESSSTATAVFAVSAGVSAPAGLTVTAATEASLTIAWNSVAGATAYELYRDDAPGGAFATEVYDGPASSCVDTGLSPNTTYYYRVLARDDGGPSPLSEVTSGTTGGMPGAPTGLAVSAPTTSTLTVTWNASAGAETYRLYRDAGEDGAFAAEVYGGPNTFWLDSGLAANTQYFYKVLAANSSGSSPLTTAASGVTLQEVVGAPTGVTATDGSRTDGVTITWNAVAGAVSYTCYRSLNADGAYESIAVVAVPTCDDSTAEIAVACYYKVSATTAGGTSPQSAYDSGYRGLAAPTGLSATDGAHTDRVALTWSPVAGATAYQVLRAGSAAGPYGLLAAPSALSYSDTSAQPGTDYYYKVRATANGLLGFLGGHEAGYRALTAPAGVQAGDGAHADRIRISWDAAAGAAGYRVYRATSNNGAYDPVGVSALASYDDMWASLNPHTYYFYKVVAYAAAGHDSGFSGYNAGWKALPAPTAIAASDSAYYEKVAVTWGAVTGATRYEVLRSTSVGGPYTAIGTSAGAAFDDRGGAPGVTYSYAIRATLGGLAGLAGAADSGTRKAVVPGTLTINSGALFTNSRSVALAMTAAGAVYMQLANDSDAWPADWIQYSTPYSWTLPDTDGSRIVRARFRDAAGYETGQITGAIALDRVPPVVTFFRIDGGATDTPSTAVTLSMSVDAVEMRFSNDGVNFSTPEHYSSTKSWTLTAGADGMRQVNARFKDAAGNYTNAVDLILYDHWRQLRVRLDKIVVIKDGDTGIDGSGEMGWGLYVYYPADSTTAIVVDERVNENHVSVDDGDNVKVDKYRDIIVERVPGRDFRIHGWITEYDVGGLPELVDLYLERLYSFDTWGVGSYYLMLSAGNRNVVAEMWWTITRLD